MPSIHPTAVVDHRAELADDVEIGPYVVIEGRVVLGPGTIIAPHSVLQGHTQIGPRCRIGPAAYIGLPPQHLKFDPRTETSLLIGEETIIRECAAVHRATKPGIENATRIGRNCFLMGASHVAHDCQIADRVVLANAVLLGGHVEVGEGTFLGGGCGIHQFERIGRLVMVSGNESLTHDIPPFAAVRYNGLKGYNAVGCRRAGISPAGISSIRAAYRCFQDHRTTTAVMDALRNIEPQTSEIREIIDFIAASKRGIQPGVRFLSQSNQVGPDGSDDA